MIEKTVSLIDTSIALKLQSSEFVRENYGLCKIVTKTGVNTQSYPASVSQVKEIKAELNQKFNLITYHREISEEFDTADGYGDSESDRVKNTMMLLVVWADSRKIKMSESKLKNYITSFIPGNLNLDITGVFSTQIELQSDTLNSLQLWQQEYGDVSYGIKPEHIFFGVYYTVITSYNADCITLCAEC